MNACFLSYDGLTDPLGTSQVLPYVEGLAAAGHRLWLISFEKPDRFTPEAQAALRARCANASITWLPQPYHKRPPVLSTLYDLWLMRRALHALHRQVGFQLLHCRGYLPMLVAMPLRRSASATSTGTRVVFDMRGFWADERVDGGLWPQRHPLYRAIYRFFKRREAHWVSGADAIVSLTYAAARLLTQWRQPQARQRPLVVIPCTADFDHFQQVTPVRRSAARAALGLPEQGLVIGYLGALGTWYRLPEMLRLFALALQRHPEARMLILTAEPRALVDAEAARHGLDPERIVVRFAPRAQLPSLMAAADVGLSFILPSFSKVASSPTKLGELLAMGIPVLANAGVGDVAEILSRTQGGHMLPDLSEASLQAAADALPELLARAPEAIRAQARPVYDLAHARAAYAGLYATLDPTSSATGSA